MSSVFQSFQKRSFIIPTSSSSTKHGGGGAPPTPKKEQTAASLLRHRLPSLSSLKIQSPSFYTSSSSSNSTTSDSDSDYSSSWAAAAFRRSKSALPSSSSSSSSMIRKWWEWGCGWILSRKPSFAVDLEMNEQESALLGRHNKGSWRHLLLKLKTLLQGADTVGGVLPTRALT
ncbi:uncharacterized protein LOC127801086 [Diospyros lotus]|uniref:uncharacterized protein LOC127801086 n=1 Tax=Diospyros lotus TaxID=55363 RepID=UPI00225A5705|nr:uncharacterized protein LOC127801086 [Diospyros lotus]